MGRRKTFEEIEIIVNDLGYDLLKFYIDKNRCVNVIIRDNYGYMADMTLSSLLVRNVNVVSVFNPYSLYNISIYLKTSNKNFYLNEENEYIGRSDKLSFHCLKCDEDFYMAWEGIIQNQNCSICAGVQIGKYNNLQYLNPKISQEWVSSENNLSPMNVTEFSGERVLWRCKDCKHEWETSVAHRSIGQNCPSCAGNVVSDKNRFSIIKPTISLEWHPIKNNDLTPNDVSYACNKKVWWLCSKCNYEWYAGIAHRSRGIGCPNCSQSKGEFKIRNFLNINNIKNIPQYSFNDCKGDKNILRFDFYLPDYNTAIEFQGEQHHKVVDFSNNNIERAKEQFLKIKKYDEIKRKYCDMNKINLLEIDYFNFNNIESILANYLNLQ